MLDECQTFKAAFLHQCVQEGLTLEETHARVKQAVAALEDPLTKEATGPWEWLKGTIPGLSAISGGVDALGKNIGSRIPGTILGLGVAAPIAAGGLAGYGLAKARGLNDEDPDEVKTRETIETLQRAATRSRLQRKLRGDRDKRKPSRPML